MAIKFSFVSRDNMMIKIFTYNENQQWTLWKKAEACLSYDDDKSGITLTFIVNNATRTAQ